MYNVEHNTSEQQPDFNVDYELLENGKCKISVNNINYNGNINKWKVKYKKENEEDWKQSNNYSFIIDELGNYRVKIANNNTESREKQIVAKTLPSEYQQVEYIESTGTQYIDTGYIANSKTNVNISFSYIENNGDQYSNGMLFGSADNLNGRPSYSIGITKDEKIFYRNSDSAESFNSDTINKNQIYRVNTFENNIEIDDTEYNNEMNLLSNAQNYSSYLFARHHPGGNDPIARCIF